jgi:translation initiation factor IF-1
MKNDHKAKESMIQTTGIIDKILPNAQYNVKIPQTGNVVLCYVCGKMSKRYTKLAVGDSVKFEMSVYDTKKGRITQRL